MKKLNSEFKIGIAVILLFVSLILSGQGYEIKMNNIVVDDTDTITTKLYLFGHIETLSEFDYFLDELKREIKFKDGTYDKHYLWLYIAIVNKFDKSKTPNQASQKLIQSINYWLKDEYEL